MFHYPGRDGVRLAYRETGDGRPLILLHGAGANTTMWMGDVASWSQDFRVYAVDIPGEPGESAPVRPPRVGDTYAEWLDDVLAGLSVERAAFVGNSLGGWHALDYAIRRPAKVEKLVLLAPAYSNRAGVPARPAAPREPAAFVIQTHEELVALWKKQAPCPGQYEQATLASVWREMLASDPVGAKWNPPARRAPVTARGPGWTIEMAKNNRIPLLMVSGQNDGQVNPRIVRNLYADTGGDKVFVDLACSSHNAMWEKNHLLLFKASQEWLDRGTVNGQKNAMLKLGY